MGDEQKRKRGTESVNSENDVVKKMKTVEVIKIEPDSDLFDDVTNDEESSNIRHSSDDEKPSITSDSRQTNRIQMSIVNGKDSYEELLNIINHQESSSNQQREIYSAQDFQTLVLAKLDAIQTQQEAMLEMMRALLDRPHSDGADIVQEDFYVDPLDTVQEFNDYNKQLSNDGKLSRKLVQYLTRFGGGRLSSAVRRIMAAVGTNRLWSNYSYKGRKGKLVFEGSPVCMSVIKACFATDENLKRHDVELCIMEVLKHSPKLVNVSPNANKRS